jgi:hypothetical protein
LVAPMNPVSSTSTTATQQAPVRSPELHPVAKTPNLRHNNGLSYPCRKD